MKKSQKSDFETHLERKLVEARRLAVVGIGDELLSYDRLGILAAKAIENIHIPGVRVFIAGTVPESVTGSIRKFRPDHVLFLDAAEMGGPPGTIRIVEPEEIHATLFSTHALPLSVVMEFLAKDAHTQVTLIGIQPDTHSLDNKPTPMEQKGLILLQKTMKRILSGPK